MIWFYLIIYGVVFGILSAIAVKNKNRAQDGWFFIGFLFGVFGLIAAALVDKVEPLKTEEPVLVKFDPSALTKKCTDCAELIKLEAKVCRYCQRRFSEEEVAASISSAQKDFELAVKAEDDEGFVCSECKTEVSADAEQCPKCGAKFDD